VVVYSNASGIISSASIVRIAPAENAWIAEIHAPDAPLRAAYPMPAAIVLAATTITHIRKMRPRDQPSRRRSLEAATASGTLERNTATTTAMLAESSLISDAPITTDSGMPSSTAPRTIPSPPGCEPAPFSRFSIRMSPAANISAPAANEPATTPAAAPNPAASSTSS
jgi:hypothetical protein